MVNLDKYAVYRETVRSLPGLSARDARALAWKACLGDRESRQELIERHLWLVVEMAERLHAGDALGAALLVADGNRILVRAAETYRPWQDGDFTEYASELLVSEMGKEALPAA